MYWSSVDSLEPHKVHPEPHRVGQAQVEANNAVLADSILAPTHVTERRTPRGMAVTSSDQAMLNVLDASAALGSPEGQDERTALLPRRRGRINWICLSVTAVAVLATAFYLGLLGAGATASASASAASVSVKGTTASSKTKVPAPKIAMVLNDLSIKWDGASLERWCADALGTADAFTQRMKRCTACSKTELLSLLNSQAVLLDNIEYMASLMEQVHPDQRVRQAARACDLKSSSADAQRVLDEDLFARFSAVAAQEAGGELEARLFEKTMMDFVRSGVHLDRAKREELQRISDTMERLAQAFDQNLANDVRKVLVPRADVPIELAGIAADFLLVHTNPSTGDVVLTTEAPTYYLAMKAVRSATLRQELFVAKLSCGMPHNERLLQELLDARNTYARLLGYSTFANYTLQNKMVRSAAHAEAFLRKVRTLVAKRAADEIELLLRKKREISEPEATQVFAYDASFLAEQIRASKYLVPTDEVRTYFTYRNVRDGLFAMVQELFGIDIHPVHAEGWHPKVRCFGVRDGDGTLLGHFFLDSFPRPHKFKHTAQFTLRKGVASTALITPAAAQLPLGALVCNFDEDGPMDHDEVVTFFHGASLQP